MKAKLDTKLERVIEKCKETAPSNSCLECLCDERECLLYLLEIYNESKTDHEIRYIKE